MVNAHGHNVLPNTLHYEKMKNIWEASYLLIYREPCGNDGEGEVDTKSTASVVDPSIDDILKLLSIIRHLMHSQPPVITSDKLNAKLIQQLQDPLCLASRSLPIWCSRLLHTHYRFLFPFETRQLYFQTTAFGVSRSIVWLQQKRDQLLMAMRSGAAVVTLVPGIKNVGVGLSATVGSAGMTSLRSPDDLLHEFRIGRLKHERVKIPREPQDELVRAAVNALRFHASRKAILEIEFVDEEGTGLGPTLEFYSLIAAQLQMKK